MKTIEKKRMESEDVKIAVHAKSFQEEMNKKDKVRVARKRAESLKEMDRVRVKKQGKDQIKAWRP